ncbi:MAG TPA: class I SAM-dependent methyltransferase [Opitutaceae bacterium]|nr:class I SAM-dependent methyltransferase [Opitutaceae bacterium]
MTLPAHRIIACRRCRIARTDPPPARIHYEDEDFHSQFAFTSIDHLPRTWRRGLCLQASLLRRHLAPGAPVFEIGCGQGLLLEAMRRAGLNPHGIEPSVSGSSAARAAGHSVQTGYFSHDRCPGPYDAIVLSHVLEHIERPARFLAEIAASAPGGLLLLVQANWRGLVPLKNRANWHAWAPTHHYWHFSFRGLKRWLRSLDIETVDREYSSLEHNDYWLGRLARLVPAGGDQFHLLARLPQQRHPDDALAPDDPPA